MTPLAIALAWSAARGSAIAALGVGVYLLARRQGPAGGSRAASATLMGLVGISILAFSPWPRWWIVDTSTIRDIPPAERAPVQAIPGKSTPKTGPSIRDRLSQVRRPVLQESSARHSRQGPEPPRAIARREAENVTVPAISGPRNASKAEPARSFGWSRAVVAPFAVGVAIGMARLVAGLVGVGRLRRSSRPVDDRDLLGLLESMRLEMKITRHVEVRETAEMDGPATTGWRRPTLYLPAAWRSWTEAETRVVLAHELAHVGRGDYPAWVAAQFGVILHFYQPMAHWLVGRLRLEQELAADDWAARHAGGRRVYLATLAALALKQEVRPAAWPVRSLFPTRKTLIRRIEMLRKNDQGIDASSRISQAFAPLAIAVAVLIVAGLRGPIEKSRAQEPSRPIEEVKAVKPVPPTIDLALIPADAPLVAAFRPADLVKLPELKALYEELTRQGEIKLIADMADLETIEQVAVVLFRGDLKLGGKLDEKDLIDAGALIIRSNKPREWKAWLLLAGMPSFKATHQGKEYYRICTGDSEGSNPGNGPSLFAYYQPDDMTVVAASEANIKAMIGGEKPKGDPKWGESVRRAARGHAFLALDVAWAREQWKPLLRELDPESVYGMALAPISPLQEMVDRQVVTLDGDEGLSIVSENFCRDDAGAERVRRTIDALIVLGQNSAGPALDAFRSQLKGELGPMAPLLELGEQAVKQGTVDREGTIVRFKTAVKGPLVSKIRSVVEAG